MIGSPPPYFDNLPSYDDALIDLPPPWSGRTLTIPSTFDTDSPPLDSSSWTSNFHPTIDWTSVDNIRSHVSKKKKQAEKKAQQSKWFESDNEGDKAGEEGEAHGDGAGGSGGAAGGSGDGGNGGAGDDDDDDWNEGGGKKKKKGKKGKTKNDEEEEEEKKEEEKKEEDAVSPLGKVPGSFWDDNAGDVDPDDEWGISTSKKKKGKKGKV